MLSNLFKNPNKIVQEIHNEIDSAQDRLLDETDLLLKELKIQTESDINHKVERLCKIGFIKSKSVIEYQNLQFSLSKQKQKFNEIVDISNNIRYFKNKYPLQKFLTETELNRICKKYKLIHAPIGNYIKDVPEKNLLEIEKCVKLNVNEQRKTRIIFKYKDDFLNSVTFKQSKEIRRGIDITDIMNDKDWLSNNEILKKYYRINYNLCQYENLGSEITHEDLSGLFIAAPKSHFDLKNLKKTGLFSYNFTLIQQNDPIVFEYCGKKLIRVISKWGLEASEPSLIND